VLLADFTADSVEIARISEPVVPLLAQTLSRSNTYDAFLDFYCGQYIVEQEHAEFMTAGSALAVTDTLKYRHCHMHSHTVYHLHNGSLQKEIITHEHEHPHIGPGIAHRHIHTGI
jgi:hypothetical protein